jgi:hypothetical protein
MNTRENLTEKLGEPVDRSITNLADKIICQHKYNLNLSQQRFLESKKNSKTTDGNILTLAQEAYKNPTLFEQTEEFKNVRKFMQKLWRNGEYQNFTDEQIDFIFENGDVMGPKELSEALFPDKEFITLVKHILPLLEAGGIKESKGEEKPDKISTRYSPPRTDLQVVNLINRSDFSAKFDHNNLDPRKKESVSAVKKFLSAPRFVEMISTMTNPKYREVFETEFVKAIYNKTELISDEVNLYIALALEYVTLLEIKQQMTILNDRLAESVSDDDEARKFTMSLSEALKDKTAAYNQCLTRTLQMTRSLSGDRIKKLEKQANAHQSLVPFIEMVKDEKDRKRMMILARAAEIKVKDRIEELDNFSELFVEVYGLGKEEAFNL